MPAKPELPIDALLPDLAAALRSHSSLVLEAPPGAGKTTRVPPCVAEAVQGQVLVLQPRRLAARLAAERIAFERGEPVGEFVGYRVRFDERVGKDTRIVFVTEGVFVRRIAVDPELRGVGAVILDEFHERHLHGDLALAWCRALLPRLKLIVMSATLDAQPIAEFLGAPRLSAEGRQFPVEVEYAPAPSGTHLDQQVKTAVRRVLDAEKDGHVLVFLPGMAEIRRAESALAGSQHRILPLHGDLTFDEQARAFAEDGARKIVLSTNVAETSVTIPGVVAVVDSGLHRQAGHDPWSGLPTLRLAKISQASAHQRAGRAGRTRAGRCLRLYSKHEFDARPSHDTPEILRLDLAELVLLLSSLGRLSDLAWLSAPPDTAVSAARELLARLGALDGAGKATEIGKRLLELPLHPRLGRVALEAEARKVSGLGALVVALLGERRVHQAKAAVASGDSDVLVAVEAFEAAERAKFAAHALRSLELDSAAVRSVDRARSQLKRLLGKSAPLPPKQADDAILRSLLYGFPDRVARRRAKKSNQLLLSGGGAATLAPNSVVIDAELMVALEASDRAEVRSAGTVIQQASSIEADWLLDFSDRIVERRTLEWNAAQARVEVAQSILYDALVIDESRGDPNADDLPQAEKLLAQQLKQGGLHALCEPDELETLNARVAFCRSVGETMPPLGAWEELVDEWTRGYTRKKDLPAFMDHVWAALGGARAQVEALAPTKVTLPSGRAARISYPPERTPFVASRLQDFFGWTTGPAIGRGRVPLLLHLLAPNQQAVQVTSDLAGFWDNHYPAIRKELSRQYPRHAWPENPRVIPPPKPRRS